MSNLIRYTIMNRFYILLLLWVADMAYCAFVSTDVYFNALALFFGYCALVLGFAYVMDNMNAKEKRFFNRVARTF